MNSLLDILFFPIFSKPAWLWLCFLVVVLLLVIFDLGLLQRSGKEIGIRQSMKLSAFYITMGLLFGAFVWYELGPQAGKDYYTGFVIEKSLSLDNIFVISLIFSYFSVPRIYQYRVLFWGIIGVIILRGLLIGIGAELVEDFEWVMYLFGAFLIYTGIKLLRHAEEEPEDIEQNKILQFLKRRMRVTHELHGKRFFVKLPSGTGTLVRHATPLFVALIVVECIDLVFALDSVPAIFAVTTDEYVVFTSNVFAILGLRALYFALSAMLHRFAYLNYSLAVVLLFIGGKVFYPLVSHGREVPSELSLGLTLAILGAGVVYSLAKTKNEKPL